MTRRALRSELASLPHPWAELASESLVWHFVLSRLHSLEEGECPLSPTLSLLKTVEAVGDFSVTTNKSMMHDIICSIQSKYEIYLQAYFRTTIQTGFHRSIIKISKNHIFRQCFNILLKQMFRWITNNLISRMLNFEVLHATSSIVLNQLFSV